MKFKQIVWVVFLASCGSDEGVLGGGGDIDTATEASTAVENEDTGTQEETDASVDTGTEEAVDTQTDTGDDTGTEEAVDTQTDTGDDTGDGTETDTDTGMGCAEMGFECGGWTGNDQDYPINCLPLTCAPVEVDGQLTYRECEANRCVLCDNSERCGVGCVSCSGETPVCATDGSGCVGCNDEADCDAEAPVCHDDGSGPRCVECVSRADCRSAAFLNQSELGQCTADNVCTCYAEAPLWDCVPADHDCPTGYVCAKDAHGSHNESDLDDHYVCLRPCVGPGSPAHEGVACEERKTELGDSTLVWVPVTSCYAFDRWGETCTSSADCRISSDLNDGSCLTFGGTDYCTYSCLDDGDATDNFCPSSSTCNVQYCTP